MTRIYQLSARVAPGLPVPPADTVRGGFSFGALDAAASYARVHLAGYSVIPGGVHLAPGLRRFEALDHAAGLACTLYVTETT